MQRFKGVGSYGTVGLDMVLAIVICLLGGRWLDNRVGAHGWLTAAGFILGVAAAFNILFKSARKLRRETEQEDRRLASGAQKSDSVDGSVKDDQHDKR